MTIEGTSRKCRGSQNNSTVMGSGDRDLAAEFKRFICFTFGDKTHDGFLKSINIVLIGFVSKQDAQGIQ